MKTYSSKSTQHRKGSSVIRITLLMILTIYMSGICENLHADPPKDRKWIAFDPMTDEFNEDSLDTTKWYPNNPYWKGRPPAFFHKDCISVSDGLLHVSAFNSTESAKNKLPKDFTHISGFIVSKSFIRFGYFEIRAKLMDSTLVSGFWLNRHTQEESSEITIIEVPAGIDKYKDVLIPNWHYFHGPHYKGTLYNHLVDPSTIELPFDHVDDFHVYGMEWTPTHFRWYVDGKLVRESKNKHHFQPIHLNINVEANDYFDAFPDDTRLPAVYEVDWVRTWRLNEWTAPTDKNKK